MSTYNVLDVKADLTGALHGTQLNMITGLDNLFNRAARQLLLDINPQETKRILQIGPVFKDVFDYALPADIKGNTVIDLFPQANRTWRDIWQQMYNQPFDVTKSWTLAPAFTIVFNEGKKYIRITSPQFLQGIVLNQANVVTGNGTWVTGTNASGITTNNTNYYQPAGSSVQFNLNQTGIASTGSVNNSTQSPIDLTTHLNQSTLFLDTFLQTGSGVTGITLKWGSSSSNYYSVTATQSQEGTAFVNGWNVVAFPWNGATVVGSPIVSSITYVEVDYAYNGTLQTGVLLNNVTSNLPNIMNMEYYSKYFFSDATTGAFQETVTDDSNLINLDTESYNLFFNLVAFYATQQQQGLSALFYDGNFFGQEYQKGVTRYTALYKSETQKPSIRYYNVKKGGYNGYLGRRIF